MSTELYERLKVAVYNFNDKSSALNHTTITFSGKSSNAFMSEVFDIQP